PLVSGRATNTTGLLSTRCTAESGTTTVGSDPPPLIHAVANMPGRSLSRLGATARAGSVRVAGSNAPETLRIRAVKVSAGNAPTLNRIAVPFRAAATAASGIAMVNHTVAGSVTATSAAPASTTAPGTTSR